MYSLYTQYFTLDADPQSSTWPAPGHSHNKVHTYTPAGSFLNKEMIHPDSPWSDL